MRDAQRHRFIAAARAIDEGGIGNTRLRGQFATTADDTRLQRFAVEERGEVAPEAPAALRCWRLPDQAA